MTPQRILACAQRYNESIGTRYNIHIGRAGKLVKIKLAIEADDCYHLMGLQYLKDRPERRSREKAFNDLLTSETYRKKLSSSQFWTNELENRIICASMIESILDNNKTIIRYNSSRLTFYSNIIAEYILSTPDYPIADNCISEIYLFIDKRKNSEERYCKSIFPKGLYDYTERQAIWHLLYKEKIALDNTSIILFQHNKYEPK